MIHKIWNWITTVLMTVVVLFTLWLIGIRILGLQPFAVLSGSMEPLYPVGSLIYVKEVDYRTLKAGDIITYMLDGETVSTHRIVKVYPDEENPEVLRYSTKGDANQSIDAGLVHCKNVIGSPLFAIPYLGFVANFIRTPPGTYAAIAAVAFLLMLILFSDSVSPEKSGKSDKQQKPPNALD